MGICRTLFGATPTLGPTRLCTRSPGHDGLHADAIGDETYVESDEQVVARLGPLPRDTGDPLGYDFCRRTGGHTGSHAGRCSGIEESGPACGVKFGMSNPGVAL